MAFWISMKPDTSIGRIQLDHTKINFSNSHFLFSTLARRHVM